MYEFDAFLVRPLLSCVLFRTFLQEESFDEAFRAPKMKSTKYNILDEG